MIDVALTPAALAPADVAVVIDVLRATTTISWALGAGYEQVHCTASLQAARDLEQPGRILAGERGCLAPEGFSHGNSPRDAAVRRGHELILASTNGTPAIVAATGFAPVVLAGALSNLEAVARALRGYGRDADVQLVCSGHEGTVALEDVYLAGRLCRQLGGERTDAARMAEAVARRFPNPISALRSARHAGRLQAAGLDADLMDCALESQLDVVGHVRAVGPRCAVLAAGAPAAHRELPAGEAPAAQAGVAGTRDRARAAAETILSGGAWCVLESCRDVPAQRWEAQLLIFDLHPDAVAAVICEEAAARPDEDLRLTACDRATLGPEPGLGTYLVYVAEPLLDATR